MQLIQMILGLANILAILDKWLSKLSLEYTKKMKEQNNVEFLQALEKARGGSTVDLARSLGELLDDD